ncbi:hypothetical protein TREMEDRAFT_35792, partial [Tremella mesenterica DSM 1558]
NMPQYPPRPPPGIRRTFWSYRTKFEVTFGFSMLEAWEKGMIYMLMLIITAVFWISVFNYTPRHLGYLHRRFSYYVFDDENVDVRFLLRDWVWDGVDGVWSGVKRIRGEL